MPPLIIGALGSIGVSGAAAEIIGNVLMSAAMMGLSLLFAPSVPKPDTQKIPLKQSIPPRNRIIGTVRVAGAYMLYTDVGDGDDSVDVLAMCHGESNEFTRLYFHDDVVAFVDGHAETDGRIDGLADSRYGHGSYLIFRYGANPETPISEIYTDWHIPTSIWSSLHRGDRITYAAMRHLDAGMDNQSRVYPFGLPIFSAAINSTKVFDPRDSSQSWANP